MASDRALFTVEEFIRDVCPMSISTFYSEIRTGRLQTVTIGRRRYVPASMIPAFIQALQASSRPPENASEDRVIDLDGTAGPHEQ